MSAEATIEAVRLRPVWGGTCWEALVFLDLHEECMRVRSCYAITENPRRVVDYAICNTIDQLKAQGCLVTNHRAFYVEHLEEIERKCKRCRRMSTNAQPAKP